MRNRQLSVFKALTLTLVFKRCYLKLFDDNDVDDDSRISNFKQQNSNLQDRFMQPYHPRQFRPYHNINPSLINSPYGINTAPCLAGGGCTIYVLSVIYQRYTDTKVPHDNPFKNMHSRDITHVCPPRCRMGGSAGQSVQSTGWVGRSIYQIVSI